MSQEHNIVSLCIIGTEITRGIIEDKHGNLIARELTNLGYHMSQIVMVPDDGTLGPILKQCAQETDIIILTGGLGPTSDDMTRHVVADLAGVPLALDDTAYQELYARIGDRIHGANQRQVFFPKGFRVIPNPKGTAPGFTGEFKVQREDGLHTVTCYAMPGPPVELHEMLYKQVLPDLAHAIGKTQIGRDEYACFLTPESKLEDVCYAHAKKGILWGTRAQEFRISLYLSGGTDQARQDMALAIQREIGDGLLREGDISVVDLLSDYLKENNLVMSCAESCTGGLVSKMMTDSPGSSSWFWGSVVSYANEAKRKMLDIYEQTLDEYGAVSGETVLAMADSMLNISGSDFTCSISGIAGPEGGTEEKPVGTVWFGFASKMKPSVSLSLQFSSYGRSSIRRRAAVAAILLGYFYLNGVDLLDIVSTWQYI
jgi:nicotinamide-nucleotide amidase